MQHEGLAAAKSVMVSLPPLHPAHLQGQKEREIALCFLCPHTGVLPSPAVRLASSNEKQPECATVSVIQLSLCLFNSFFFVLTSGTGLHILASHSVHTGITGILQSLMPTATPAYVLFVDS